MKINGCIFQNNIINPSFGNWTRTVYRDSKKTANYSLRKVKHRNDTCFFRELNWRFFSDLLKTKYKNVPKVNIYNYGCSDGEESLSIVMKLLADFGSESEKFFPIIAKDYDEYAINQAKKNEYQIKDNEISAIDFQTKNCFKKFFSKQEKNIYKANPVITKNVKYSVSDILKDCKKITGDNNIIFARNFWPYLSTKNKYKLAQSLHENMGRNSMLVIGEYDYYIEDDEVTKILVKSGFKSISSGSMIYVKQNESAVDNKKSFFSSVLDKLKKLL